MALELVQSDGGYWLRHRVLEDWHDLGSTPIPSLSLTESGHAVVQQGDLQQLAHELLPRSVHTAASGVLHVLEKSSNKCLLLTDIQRNYSCMCFDVREQTFKIYIQAVNIQGAYLFWSAQKWWESLGFELQGYQRGGVDSCRYLLDRLPSWEKACMQMGVPITHLQRTRTSTRGPNSRQALERIFPEICMSTFAMIAILIHLAGTMTQQGNRDKCIDLLGALCRLLLPRQAQCRIFLDDHVTVMPGVDVVCGAHSLLLDLRGEKVDVTNLLSSPKCQLWLQSLVVENNVFADLSSLILIAYKKQVWWFLKQFVHILATAFESDFENKAPKLRPVSEALAISRPKKEGMSRCRRHCSRINHPKGLRLANVPMKLPWHLRKRPAVWATTPSSFTGSHAGTSGP